ncbi:MAG: hypothetical protein GX610_01295 [Rhodococcus sp.]|nr:hypothetical protein [Rhodococcus sp. (in: high G+C Gram-positive bacteria)]
MPKHIDVLRFNRQPGETSDREVAFQDLVERLLGDETAIGIELNVPWPDSAPRASRRVWPDLGPIDAILSRWYRDTDRPGDGASLGDTSALWSFAVDEHIGIERTNDWPDGTPTPGLKHISLLCGTCPTDEFRVAYRHHVELVHEHLPTMWRYVQNDIESATGDRADEFAAISELSYRTHDDYERRWRYGAAGEVGFRSHEGFLDLPKTVTLMCTEHILRSSV